MGKIIYLPFEELPQRYTEMWNKAIIKNLDSEDLVVYGTKENSTITTGEFLDTYATIIQKSEQIKNVAKLFQKNLIKNGDIFFVPDIFYNGLSALRYMAELSNIDIKIAAFNHAGRADKTDFVQHLNNWADTQEQAWHQLCDVIFVGSNFHKHNVERKFKHKNIIKTGAVWDSEWMKDKCKDIQFGKKEEYVIFPHRPCEEKRFLKFLEIARKNPELRFVITTCGNNRLKEIKLPNNVEYRYNLTKEEYFEIFARAKYYLSIAKQETFGYTIQEAIFFGCKIIVANHPCYKEYVAKSSIFPLRKILQENFLTQTFKNSKKLCESKQFYNNASRIVELLKSI